jgi:hypothetical protein
MGRSLFWAPSPRLKSRRSLCTLVVDQMITRRLLLGFGFLVAGCSLLPRHKNNNPPIDIEVLNDLVSREDLAVYVTVLPSNRHFLGDVRAGQTSRFSYRPPSYAAHYRLTAVAPFNRRINSRDFIIDSAGVVEVDWQISLNLLSFRQPE